ncbi:MAG: porin family protein [Alphaproteobacteria bacterium]|nr:porin family protein [Alphaproteobacteria bacterium]
MKKLALLATIGCFAVSGVSAEEVVLDEASTAGEDTGCFDSIYGGLGFGGSFLKVGNEKFNRFMGSLVFGGGKVFNDQYYCGLDAIMDFMSNKDKGVNDGILKNKGFNPQVGVRFGYLFDNVSMVYGRLGLQYSKCEFFNSKENTTSSETQWAPVVALGGERARVWKSVSARVEAEYAFGKKHGGTRANKGWNVRLLGAYNFKY